MTPGDLVVLNVPDNPRLHGASAVVDRPTEWGAHVRTAAAVTGMFRALHGEMQSIRADPMLAEALATAKGRRAREQGYTGDVCDQCQGCRLRRTGTCVTCEDCGRNEGCG